MTTATATFEADKTYTAKSICDSETIFSFAIIRRTAKTIWTTVHGEAVSRRISADYDGAECFYPFGKYSMAPCVRASRVVVEEAEAIEEVVEIIEEPAQVTTKTKFKKAHHIEAIKTAAANLLNIIAEHEAGARGTEDTINELYKKAGVVKMKVDDYDAELYMEDAETFTKESAQAEADKKALSTLYVSFQADIQALSNDLLIADMFDIDIFIEDARNLIESMVENPEKHGIPANMMRILNLLQNADTIYEAAYAKAEAILINLTNAQIAKTLQ